VTASGKQTIRILFTHPQWLRRIWMSSQETEAERTQEYVLRWSPDSGQSFQEIVRQQWNFSPHGTTNETEDHHVDLPAVTLLELSIIPDMSREKCIRFVSAIAICLTLTASPLGPFALYFYAQAFKSLPPIFTPHANAIQDCQQLYCKHCFVTLLICPRLLDHPASLWVRYFPRFFPLENSLNKSVKKPIK
jgi:hypothetical protein